MRRLPILICVVCVVLLGAAALRWGRPGHLRVSDPQTSLAADGRYHHVAAVGLTRGRSLDVQALSVSGIAGRVTQTSHGGGDLAVQSTVLAAVRRVQVRYGQDVVTIPLRFVISTEDTGGTGTPDFLRLHTAEDRSAFRGWFTALAEAAADLPPAQLPREVNDCAALLRWCYRNALHAHDETWLSASPEGLDLSRPSVQQYAYPLTPLGAGLFRVREGAFTHGDESNGAFAAFADARTLWQRNTFLLSRDALSARPGDLLFFRQLEQNSPFHSMIVTAHASVIYHTGLIGRGPGEMRRVLLSDLLQHPDPRWRPVASNSNFLGVYRWNILQEDPR